MTKRILKLALVAALIVGTLLMMFACGEPEVESKIPKDLDLSGITLPSAEYFYDGEEHSLAVKGTLPEKVSVVYEGNSQTKVGTHSVTAKFYYEDEYIVGKDIKSTLKIKELSALDLSGVALKDKSVTYSGAAVSLAVSGTLPEGVSVSYTGNGKTDAGTYTVGAKFYYKGIYIEGKDLSAKLTIARCDLSEAMYGVAFNNTTVIYDGQAHSIYVTGNLPDAVSVEYTGNGVIAVGNHTVTAKFTVDEKNYLPIPNKTATISIKVYDLEIDTPQGVVIPADIMANKTVTYNGEAHGILADENRLPAGVTVEYVGGGAVNAGEYNVTAKFYYNGIYLKNEDVTKKLTINPISCSIADVVFGGATVVYDGSAHGITVAGTLPTGVKVSYTGNGAVAVGDYTVSATFSAINGNYVITDAVVVKTATLSIVAPQEDVVAPSLSGITLQGAELTYDGLEHSLAVSGTLPAGVTVEYFNNGKVNAGEHTVTAKFYYYGNYISGEDMTATLIIKQVECVIDGLKLNNATVLFDGLAHSIAVEGDIPDGVKVSYTGNGVTAPGTHPVTATLSAVNGNYKLVGAIELHASIEIFILSTEMMGLEFSDGEFVYDGKAHSLEVKGLDKLSSAITLMGYEGNDKVNVDTYTVVAKFAINGTYAPELDMTATLTIKKAIIKASVSDTDISFTFDGAKKSPTLTWDGEKPDAVTVKVIGEAQRLPGVYKIIYKFIVDAAVAANYEAKEDITVTMTITDAELAATEGIEYTLNSDGTYHVSGYTGTSSVVIIPSTHEGQAVTFIAARAFENNKKIEYVRVPDSVVVIGQAAFRGCDNIDTITLPFLGGSVGSSKKYLGYIFGASEYGGNAQFLPTALRVVELSDACTLIPAYSMYGCSQLTEVRIGAGVTEIGTSAFRGCTSLKGIYIPAGVTLIRAAAHDYNSPFFDCDSEFAIYLGADSVPDTYGKEWNTLDTEGGKASVKAGKTYQEYLDEVKPYQGE